MPNKEDGTWKSEDWYDNGPTGLFAAAAEELMRRGYIKGQTDYDGSNPIGAVFLETETERDGWYMGYNARATADTLNLESSQIGTINQVDPLGNNKRFG